ncbi:MAG: polyphosphate polymerase domain-containing protein [Lachnospiraceae bacterium]|nr:polyphosphate polymerase domain-containing protein [Lachnospiraceae bacterium]
MKYRVEQKYIITEEKLAYLKYKLEQVMQYDEHTKEQQYRIRSLYFDDMYDSYLEENEEGNDFREKYRIRTYNNQLQKIHLEIKAKERGYTSKVKEELSKEECEFLMHRKHWSLKENDGFVKQKLYALMLMRRIQPVQIVEYDRVPFVEENGNVRVTFDKNIVGTGEVTTFFDDIIPGIPLLPTGHHILEVKYDEFIPDYIKQILNEVHVTKTAFSKYYYARKNQNIYG